jgi:DNA invertase Pin-like site-specific DNA recombinase
MRKVIRPKPTTTLIPAAGYLRRSGDDETQKASIPEQKEAVQKYAEEKGYHIVRWYIDDAISGDDTKNRAAFLRMVRDATTLRDFKAIICWDGKRFGRFNSIEYGYYVYPLWQAGVHLATVMEGVRDWDDPTTRIVENVHQEGRHKDLLDHSANVTRGQLGSMNAGSWIGSPPYAYRIEGARKAKRLVLDDPGKVRIVQRIFREFIDGRSMHNIAERLNAEGVVSPGGYIPGTKVRNKQGQVVVRGWRWDSVKVILENPAYTGDYAACRWSYGRYHRIKDGKVEKSTGRTRNKDASQWIVHRDHHEAIVDRETFDRAQQRLALTKPGKNPRYTPEENPYLLSCLLRCGRCGSMLYALTKQSRKYYECGNRHYNGKGACEGCTVREDFILKSIADALDEQFLLLDGKRLEWAAYRKELRSPDDLPKAFAAVRALVAPPKQSVADRDRELKQTKGMVARLNDRIDKARGNLALLDPENIPAVQDKIREMLAEKEVLEAELRKTPPTEADINDETMEVLQSLSLMAWYFRFAAQVKSYEEDWDGDDGVAVWGDVRPECRRILRSITGITVHTTITGRGNGVRHSFLKGEIEFRGGVRVDPGNLNPHRPGKSRKCCP